MFFLALGLALIVRGQTTAPTSTSTTITFATTTTLSIPSGCTDKVTQTATAVTIVQTCIANFTPPSPAPVTGNATIIVPGATVGKPYSVNVAALIAAKGGTPPYTYSAQSVLPAGIIITPQGVLVGTPTVAGTFNITIGVNDSSGGTTSASHITVSVLPRSGR